MGIGWRCCGGGELGKTVELIGGEAEREMEMTGLVFRKRREGLGRLRYGQPCL
jgi:hypothetical protein